MIKMAEKRETYLVDDLDGTTSKTSNVSTVEFGLDGKTFEIELSDANAAKLRVALEPFLKAARKTGTQRGHLRSHTGGKSSSAARPVSADREQNQAIRAWAIKRGMKISDRGRIPAEVLEAYHREAQAPAPAGPAPAPATPPKAVTDRIAAAINAFDESQQPPVAKSKAAPRKPRGNGKVAPPKGAPAGQITRLSKLSEAMMSAVCENLDVIEHGTDWVELAGTPDDIAAKITAVQSDMPGQSATQRAAKSSLTRVAKELRNSKSRKVEVRDAA